MAPLLTFEWPLLLWGLLLVPLTGALLGWAARRRRRAAEAFADAHLLPAVVRRAPPALVRWTLALQLLALAALLLAAGRPRAAPPLPHNRAAVVIALDASRSMLADDVPPSRLEAGRALAREFVQGAPADARIGVVSFSDVASVLVPPTHARDEVLDALERVTPARNTSLAAAVVAGVRMLPGRADAAPPEALAEAAGLAPGGAGEAPGDAGGRRAEPPPGALLIFSDGVSNVTGNPALPPAEALEQAAGFAAEQGVTLHTVALGRAGGTVARIDGRDFFVPFEDEPLRRLAERGGGRHLAPDDSEALARVFAELGRAVRWERTEVEVSAGLAGLAAALLLGAAALSWRWRRRVP